MENNFIQYIIVTVALPPPLPRSSPPPHHSNSISTFSLSLENKQTNKRCKQTNRKQHKKHTHKHIHTKTKHVKIENRKPWCTVTGFQPLVVPQTLAKLMPWWTYQADHKTQHLDITTCQNESKDLLQQSLLDVLTML